MARQTAWVLALVLTCAPAAGASAAEAQSRPAKADAAGKDRPQPASRSHDRWKWWLYDRAELGITDQQSSAINDIFEATIPSLREARQALDRAEDELSKTIKEHKADIAVVSLQLDRVENARSQHNKMRTLMLYRIHALLSAEQRTKLEALRARRDRESPSGRR